MRAVAAWLVARPQNAALGLAATLLLPLVQVVSGIILVLLVLKQGARVAVLEALAAGAFLAIVGLIVGAPFAQVVVSMATTWLPALLLAVALQTTRSLTLTLQLSIIVAVVAIAGFYLVVTDVVDFWQPVLTKMAEVSRDMGLNQQAELLAAQPELIAGQMTMLVVFSSWTMYAGSCLLGYGMYRLLPAETEYFGRFQDLNFGRVIALMMALASLIAVFSGTVWLQNTAFVLFAVFWVQGLALLHWLHGEGHLPVVIVIAAYATLPVLHVFVVITLAVLGYTDAWFDYRRRVVKKA